MKPRPSHQRNRALTLVEVLVVIAVVVFLVGFLFPALKAAKQKALRINCLSSLKAGGCAFRLWAGDNNNQYPTELSTNRGGAREWLLEGKVFEVFRVMSNELSTPKILWCPADADHIAATNFSIGFSEANISYFVSLDAAEAYPQMIMAGDDNLQVNGKPVQPGILDFRTVTNIAWTKDRHNRVGNIGMADGSVQQTTSGSLNSAIGSCTNGVPTNNAAIRWLIP
jgi:prepilin-type processing-associated H-X9-DG protein